MSLHGFLTNNVVSVDSDDLLHAQLVKNFQYLDILSSQWSGDTVNNKFSYPAEIISCWQFLSRTVIRKLIKA